MSERGEGGGRGGSGVGPFLLGVAVGAVIGFLFAPEPGEATRAKVSQKLRGLKQLASEKAGQVADRVLAETVEPAEPEARLSAREELERRLAEARRRRRTGGGPAVRGGRGEPAAAEVAEEDEPVA